MCEDSKKNLLWERNKEFNGKKRGWRKKLYKENE